jgi:2-keto-4-pentenoate hydratase/2-oxohepta-3-ene-1,7-dioic acid hydratase in catechol pathway
MKTIKFKNKTIIPSKIVCVGRNYVEHIKELNNEVPENMVLFNKPNSAISDKFYFINEYTRFEGEICFLIQNKKIAGVGFGFDLTKKDIQEYLKQKGLPWERAKAFNNSAIFSEFVELNGDISTIEMKLYMNNTLQQHATYDLMIYKPHQILNEILNFMDLEDGDIIMSGTPKGVSFYNKYDKFKVEVYLENKIIINREWEVL